MRWEVLKSEMIYRCRIFSVRRDRSRSARSGQAHDFHVIEAGDWVNVVPLTNALTLVAFQLLQLVPRRSGA